MDAPQPTYPSIWRSHPPTLLSPIMALREPDVFPPYIFPLTIPRMDISPLFSADI